MKKIKVTYFTFGNINEKIFFINDWYNIMNDITIRGIILNDILKIELVLEANPQNIIDETKEN